MRQVGLIGFPVAHSLSPRMQQAAFDASGIAARYTLWETPPADLAARVASLRAPEMLGANVTIPHKTAALEYVDDCDPLAARVGAINTIVNRDGRLVGYNTDVGGLMQALAANKGHPFHGPGKNAIILGTGGAARGAAVALLGSGVAELVVLGRNAAHLRSFVEHLQAATRGSSASVTTHLHAATLGSPEVNQLLARADLLVNATSVGLHENDEWILIDIDCLSSDALVMDMIFNPPTTPLLRAALARGCAVMNGLSMLLYQGALAFEVWTGQAAPLEVMRQALGFA
jgi:shikimate dehydrogenase